MYYSNENFLQIKEVLRRFQEGYTNRNTQIAEAFVDELYITEDSTYLLGTGTGELFLGRDKIVELIRDDWSYWGDVNLNVDDFNLSMKEDLAWIAVQGTVKYSFEDTPARYDSYLNFIRQRLEDQEVSAEQKLTFLNWALMLTYHQREDKRREYYWPLCLTGVLKRIGDEWRFVQQHFSISVADYPDERFEASAAHVEAYQNQNEIVSAASLSRITEEDRLYLKTMADTLFGHDNLTDEGFEGFFSGKQDCIVIAPDHTNYTSKEEIRAYFEQEAGRHLSLDIDYAIVSKHKELAWITVTGTTKQELEKREQLNRTMELLKGLTESDASSKDKIFMVQRRIAYLLKELSSGGQFTYPVRLSIVLSKDEGKTEIRMLHLSHPSYWVFEGKHI